MYVEKASGEIVLETMRREASAAVSLLRTTIEHEETYLTVNSINSRLLEILANTFKDILKKLRMFMAVTFLPKGK